MLVYLFPGISGMSRIIGGLAFVASNSLNSKIQKKYKLFRRF